jgi:thymidylate synthase
MMTTYRSVNEALPVLAHLLNTDGEHVYSRAGRTRELTFQHFTISDPLQREIVVKGRKANIAAQIAETMWVLGGRNDVDFLSHYLPRAADFSDDGKTWRAGYGPRLRQWIGEDDRHSTDQLEAVIALLREDPSTRRAVMSIFDPAVDYQPSKDIPCNNWLHFLSRDGVLHLHVAIRSNDLVWGWSGINQFEWSVLLEVVSYYTGLKPGSIHYAVSSLHMYDRHWDKAQQWKPRTVHTKRDRRFDPHELEWDLLVAAWFRLEAAVRHGSANGDNITKAIAKFPEPMLRGWLYVLAWWWTGDEEHLTPVQDTRLWHAAQVGTGPRKAPVVAAAPAPVLPERHLLVPPNASDEAARAVEMQPTRYDVRYREDVALKLAPPTDSDRMAQQVEGQGLARAVVQRAHPANAGRFVQEVIQLHIEKHAAYGASWKKRGELFSILPNIARKADRLGAGDTTDENQTDTAVDLMVYLAKYRTFLADQRLDYEDGSRGVAPASDTPEAANRLIARMVERATLLAQPWTTSELEDELRQGVDEMMAAAEAKDPNRARIVGHLHERATILAMRRWRETPALFARPVGESDDYRGADHD